MLPKITARFAEGFQDNRNLSYVDYSGASHFGKKRKLIRERQSRIMSRLRYLLVPSRKKYKRKLLLRESIVFCNSSTIVLLATPITASTWASLPAFPKCLYLLNLGVSVVVVKVGELACSL